MDDDQEQPDDIPMMDAPEQAPNLNPSSSAQRFSIVDVLGGDAVGAGVGNLKKEMITAAPDPMHSDLYECDEGKVMQRLQQLYPHTDIQKLPRFWSKIDRWMPPSANSSAVNQMPILELSADFLRVTKRKGNSHNSKDAAAVRANRPIPRSTIVYYFEVTVVSKGQNGYMGVGLSEKAVSLNRLPGWDQTSYGYHGDDGNFFASSGKGVEYAETFTTGDVIGCGLNFVTREIFFTKNGRNLSVANSQPIPLANDLYPTIGMQTADEMVCWELGWGRIGMGEANNHHKQTLWQIDANFGQRPFVYDIRADLEAAEAATLNGVNSIELPAEKVLWMNSLISNWMAHEGYSRSLEALNRATGGVRVEQAPTLTKSASQGSTNTSSSKDSQSPTAVAEKVAETVMRSMIGLLGGENGAGAGARRSVVRSVQEALHEEMEQRRALVQMVKRGELAEAIDRVEQLYPNLLDSNRQLAILLKTQQFVEMLKEISKELPPLHQPEHEQQQLATTRSQQYTTAHSPSPRPSSSSNRGGKRSASAVEYACASTSADDGAGDGGGGRNQHNPVKRRSSDEECPQEQRVRLSPRQQRQQQQSQNGNSSVTATAIHDDGGGGGQQHAMRDEYMEISGEESQDGQLLLDDGGGSDGMEHPTMVANGQSSSTNGCSHGGGGGGMVGTPPISTTAIIDEPLAEIFEMSADGMSMEVGEEQQQQEEEEQPDYGGFESVEEQSQFERYAVILEFGQQISQLSLKLDAGEDVHPPQNSAALRQRMNGVFSLLCYRDPTQSDHAYLLDKSQRDMVAKALNAAILESHGKEGISPLDKCLRRSRYIREQALACSASAVFADANRLLFGEHPAVSPNHYGSEMVREKPAEGSKGAQEGQGKLTPKMIQQMDAQKKEM